MQIFKEKKSEFTTAKQQGQVTTNTHFDICRLKIKHANKYGGHIH